MISNLYILTLWLLDLVLNLSDSKSLLSILFSVSMFNIDSFVAGAGWLGNHLALLVVPKDEELSGKGQRPQMKLVEPHQESYNEISADVLSIRGFQEYACNEYHLGMQNNNICL